MSLIMTSTGLQYEDLTVGDGEEASAGSFVSVHYTGWLQNPDGSEGEKFDSSVDRDEPFEFPLGAGPVIGGRGAPVRGQRALSSPLRRRRVRRRH